jgi:hypothetical protein
MVRTKISQVEECLGNGWKATFQKKVYFSRAKGVCGLP